jgi:hypothetical protein
VESEDEIRRELTLLRRALAEHDAHRELEALELLDLYDATFAAGQLSVEASSLRVLTLCSLARNDEAARVARQLRTSAPESPAVRRLTSSCAPP